MEIKFRLFRSVPREPVSRIFTRAFISNSANERLTLLTRETVQARASRSFVSPNPLFCSSESNESVKKKKKKKKKKKTGAGETRMQGFLFCPVFAGPRTNSYNYFSIRREISRSSWADCRPEEKKKKRRVFRNFVWLPNRGNFAEDDDTPF